MIIRWIKKNSVAILATITLVSFFLVPTTFALAQSSLDLITGNGQIKEPPKEQGILGFLGNGVGWALDFVSNLLGAVPVFIGRVIQAAGAVFLNIGAKILELSIIFSIGDGSGENPIDKIDGIQVGWTVMRDFANLFFIFIILFIAIKTILQLGGRETKEMLVRVIVVALLINFSAFFTKVVIDAGNVVAVGFYNRILDSDTPRTGTNTCDDGEPCSIADRFIDAANIVQQTNYDRARGESVANKLEDNLGPMQRMLFYMLSGGMFFVLGALFIKGAFYFIARMIAFCFLIMFSPIAFLSYAFPSGKVSKFMDKWWGELLSYTILAPLYMIIMYLVLQVISNGGILGGSATVTIMDFILVAGLLYAGTNLAFELADSMGTSVANWGSRLTTGAALGAFTGGSAYLARQTIGRKSEQWAKDDKLKAAAQMNGVRGSFARLRMATYEKGAKGSWDVSQSKYGGLAAGAMGADIPEALQRKGGFKRSGGIEHALFNRGKITKEQEEDYAKRAKELFPDDPIAQQNFLRNNMGHDGYIDPEKWAGVEKKAYEEAKKAHPNDLVAQKKFANTYFKENTRLYNADTTKNKDARDIDRKAKEKESIKKNQDNIRNAVEEKRLAKENLDAMEAEISTLKGATDATSIARVEELKKQQADIDNAIVEHDKALVQSIRELGAKLVPDLDADVLGSEAIAPYLTRAMVSQIHQNERDGKYKDPKIMENISKNVFASGREDVKQYLVSPEGQEKLFNYQVPVGVGGRPVYVHVNKKLAAKQRLQKNNTDKITRWEAEMGALDRGASDYTATRKEYEQNIANAKNKLEELGADIEELS